MVSSMRQSDDIPLHGTQCTKTYWTRVRCLLLGLKPPAVEVCMPSDRCFRALQEKLRSTMCEYSTLSEKVAVLHRGEVENGLGVVGSGWYQRGEQ